MSSTQNKNPHDSEERKEITRKLIMKKAEDTIDISKK